MVSPGDIPVNLILTSELGHGNIHEIRELTGLVDRRSDGTTTGTFFRLMVVYEYKKLTKRPSPQIYEIRSLRNIVDLQYIPAVLSLYFMQNLLAAINSRLSSLSCDQKLFADAAL